MADLNGNVEVSTAMLPGAAQRPSLDVLVQDSQHTGQQEHVTTVCGANNGTIKQPSAAIRSIEKGAADAGWRIESHDYAGRTFTLADASASGSAIFKKWRSKDELGQSKQSVLSGDAWGCFSLIRPRANKIRGIMLTHEKRLARQRARVKRKRVHFHLPHRKGLSLMHMMDPGSKAIQRWKTCMVIPMEYEVDFSLISAHLHFGNLGCWYVFGAWFSKFSQKD